MNDRDTTKTGTPLPRLNVTHRLGAWAGNIVLAALAVGLVGCRSFPITPSGMMAQSLDGVVTGMRSHPDPELVRSGAPALLLLIDGLLTDAPENPDLLLTGTAAYTTYCQAFLTGEDDQPRAALLYERAKNRGLRLLSQQDFFAKALLARQDVFEAALQSFRRRDVPGIYWTGAAWLGAILSQPDSMSALSELPKALALMKRVLELDESFQQGRAHLAMGIYYAVQPPGAGRDLARSRHHFGRAKELAGPTRLTPLVLLAEFYATSAADPQLFLETLTTITETKLADLPGDDALANAVAQQRAQWLRDNRGDYFPELDETDKGDNE